MTMAFQPPQNQTPVKNQNYIDQGMEAVREEAAKLRNEETLMKIAQGILPSD